LWSFSAGFRHGAGTRSADPGGTRISSPRGAEELGFISFSALLWQRSFDLSLGSLLSRGAYSLFLGFSAALLIGLQTIFIAAGILGLVPLSGVVTPFVNYGKSSTIANFALLGILASLSRGAANQEPSQPFRKQIAWVTGLMAAVGIVILLRARAQF
jgi:hypothetical protein